jgi:hypothetical protein
MDALAAADDVAVRMIDTSVVRVTSTEFVSRGAEKNISAGREAGLPARFTLSWTPPRAYGSTPNQPKRFDAGSA